MYKRNSGMPPIDTGWDFLLLLVLVLIMVPIVAAVLYLEVILGIRIGKLSLAGEHLYAFGWTVVFALVISAMGFVNGLAKGTQR